MKWDLVLSEKYYHDRCALLEEENKVLHQMLASLPWELSRLPANLLEKWEKFYEHWEEIANA